MPNPDFTGSVLVKRCETCPHWHRMAPLAALGSCSHPTHRYAVLVSGSSAGDAVTTDLSVCSNWQRKDEE